jgi:hypothetical protein
LDAPATYQAVCEKLRKLGPGALIGIEGFCSSGKSTLADRLGNDIQADVVHTDSFAIKFDDPPPYLDCLKVSELARTLAQRPKTRHCIVEGICLRDILARCNADAAFYLYVKRIGQNEFWHDELHLQSFENGDPEDGDEIEPHLSDLKYHARTRPHEKADAVFHRMEDEGDV